MNFNDIASRAASAVVSIPCAVILQTTPAIAGESQPGNIKPTKKAYSTLVRQLNNYLTYDGSLSAYDPIPTPLIDYLFPNPKGDRTPKCGDGEITVSEANYCPASAEIFLILSKLNKQSYNDHFATQAVAGLNIYSAYTVARQVANHATSTLNFGFEDSERQSLLHDCFSGELLRSVYVPSGNLTQVAETVGDDMSRFMNLGLEKHSGGDPNLAAIKRAAFQFGFNPSNSCLDYKPPVTTGYAFN